MLNNRAIPNRASLHAQFATQASILSLLYKQYYKKVKYSFTFHAHDIYFSNKWFGLLVNESKLAFSISNYNLEYIENKFQRINKKKLSLSRLGVFLPKPIETSRQKIFTIGFLSWWVEKKGLLILLQAAVALLQKHKLSIKIILAGDGPLRESALKYIRENNLTDYIEDRGKIFGQEKKDFYSNIDVFVLPSIQTKGNSMDGIPVVLMEAASYGIPMISSDISGIPEICKHNYNGFLVRPGDSYSLSEAIFKLYNLNDFKFQIFKHNACKSSHEYDIILNSQKKLKKIGWLNRN